MIYILTGHGKGKTTSALGMGIRAVGAGKSVFMVQFLKTKSSESTVIKNLEDFDFETFGKKGFFVPQDYLKKHSQLKKLGVKEASEDYLVLVRKGLNLAKEVAGSKKCDLLILDEACIALSLGFFKLKEILDFLKEYGEKLDIVLTGRNCPEQLFKIADLVTEFKEKKHYYKKGVRARKGIEY